MNPKVSVITPTHKRAHFLSRAVDSILSQTYDNIQVVVVDDNSELPESRRETEKIMEKYKDDSRVVFVENPKNLGGGLSRNMGISVCDGEYIAFLDDDDEYEPPKIETQVKFMIMHDLDFCFTDLHLYTGDGKLVEHRKRRFVTDWSTEKIFRNHIVDAIATTSTFMVKKDCIEKFGGFRGVPMGQDFMLMWDALKYGLENENFRIGYLPVSYIKQYLHNEGRISLGKNKINGENNLYNVKCSETGFIDKKDMKKIDARHYCVLCISCMRSKMYKEAAKYFIRAFNASPVFVAREGYNLIR